MSMQSGGPSDPRTSSPALVPAEPSPLSAFRPVPRTGVIYVTAEATRHGYRPDDPSWCNLGQGQPETGPLPGAPARIASIPVDPADHEYSPVAGLWELRETVASLYNRLYRRGMPSQYTAENVAIGGGGRVSIMRACAAVGAVHVGHFLPDYTAYEELLDVFRRFTPIPILLDPESGYDFSVRQLRREVLGRGLSALLLSNPCNPTGKLIGGEELRSWVSMARELDCALLLDEFYSHYIWKGDGGPNMPAGMSSAAAYVEDVDRDPVVIFDGLTKNWRYPGFRICWTVAPKSVVQGIASAGSFLDGGPSRPMQRATIGLLDEEATRKETTAIHEVFTEKRQLMLQGLRRLGVRFDLEPEGTFYCWGDLSGLPPTLRDGEAFFRAALEQKIITVPGAFFDIDPGKRRGGRTSRFQQHTRFSFGPSKPVLEQALRRLGQMIRAAEDHG
jgi:aspartate/methionine/tyrosine aminotransferase